MATVPAGQNETPCKQGVYGGGGNRTRETFPPAKRRGGWFIAALVAALVVAGTVEHGHAPAADAAPAHSPAAVRVVTRRASSLTTIRLTLAFECIHQYEGAWNANTGNGYHGGLQMDADFERTYGRAYLRHLGHANRWPAAVQIAVAIRAFHSGRGFGPWPQTRKKCGL